MIQQIIILLVGFIFLVKGADWFVDGAGKYWLEKWVFPTNHWSYNCCYGNKYA